MRRLIILVTLLVAGYFHAQSQFKNIQLPRYKGMGFQYEQCEPAIAIDPANPKRMAAGSILDAYYFSENGGKTWKSRKLKSIYGVYGDPVLTFDQKGRLYYFHLANYHKTSWLDRIVCQSTDALDGTFTEGTFPKPNGSKAQDKHWVTVDPKSNTIYLTWTQFDAYDSKNPNDSSVILFSKSTDQGATWSLPKRISKFAGDCLDGDLTVEGAVPTVGSNGKLFVAWSGPKGLVLQKSEDQGNSWLPEEQVIMPHPEGWDITIPGLMRANGLPILTSDLSNGPRHGTLYLNWCDQSNGTSNTDVWLSTSTDNGQTWSAPIRVNQDNSEHHQFFTWMTVDQTTGSLYVVYYDRRNHSDTQTDVYLSYSNDGGRSFHDFKISQEPFEPNPTIFFGDYLNIAAVNGEVRPIWPRLDDKQSSLWTALIEEAFLLKLIGK